MPAAALCYKNRKTTRQGCRAADHVDQILKGAKPADLLGEQIFKRELIIVLRGAQEVRTKVPQELLFASRRATWSSAVG